MCPLAPARAQFFFWDRPERPEPEQEPALTGRQIRSILVREGAYMIGRPHLRGDEIIAIGRDRAGAQRRFTLDAISGEVLDIRIISGPPEAQQAGGEAAAQDRDGVWRRRARPMPPPEHAPHGGDDGQMGIAARTEAYAATAAPAKGGSP